MGRVKARFVLISVIGLLSAPQAAIASAPPQLASPADGATLTIGQPLSTFALSATVADAAPSTVDFYVSTSSATDSRGLLADPFSGGNLQSSSPQGSNPATYGATPPYYEPYVYEPGHYYWQAFYIDCSGPDCYNESAIRAFTVQRTPLETFLNRHPPAVTRRRDVSFSFSSNDRLARFQCLYQRGWRGCVSPVGFHLSPGHYSFQVRARNYGLTDPTPASWSFRVLRR